MMDTPLLETRGLSVGYGVPLVCQADIVVSKGEVVGLIGPNGSGKSTIVRTIAGLLRPISGEVRFRSEPINRLPVWRRVRDLGVSYVLQEGRNFPGLTVRETLHLALWSSRLGWSDRETRVQQLLARDLFRGLRNHLAQAASSLSGGEDLILALAKCVLQQSQLVLLDEPSAGLAEARRPELLNLLSELRAQAGIILAEQSLQLMFSVATRIYFIRRPTDAGPATLVELSEDNRARLRRSYEQNERGVGVETLMGIFR